VGIGWRYNNIINKMSISSTDSSVMAAGQGTFIVNDTTEKGTAVKAGAIIRPTDARKFSAVDLTSGSVCLVL
jgi:hypothetical protein